MLFEILSEPVSETVKAGGFLIVTDAVKFKCNCRNQAAKEFDGKQSGNSRL